ncbi:MAG: hypothetical protein WD904_03810 [Dehalococcoidia bacterium]
MKTYLIAAAFLALVAGGCGDDDDDIPTGTASVGPDSTITATPAAPEDTLTATPASTLLSIPPAGFDEFRTFGAAIDQAIQAQDVDFFLRDPVISTEQCPNILYQCTQPVSGIMVGLWRSEGRPMAMDEFKTFLSDRFALGFQLAALATLTHDSGGAIGGPVDIAVVMQQSDPTTNAYVLFFERNGAGWRLKLLMNSGRPSDESNEWLSGTCAECYDYFELWEE